jgi:divalent metal cation (Fe/Co/Zn/Cd) transporter
MNENEKSLYRKAFLLSLVTVFYNLAEGLVSLYFGYRDEALTLAGFGADSFIEVLSGTGIAVMVIRIRNNPGSSKSPFEKTALYTAGTAFFLLCAALFAGIVFSLLNQQKPGTSLPGVIISLLSIAVMIWLARTKWATGKKLGSEPIIADANCTRVCIYMSVVLLASSLIYELTGFAYADILGSAGLIWFSFSEGREAFEKARAKDDHCCTC